MKSSKFLFYFKNGSDAEIRSPKESDVRSRSGRACEGPGAECGAGL